MNYKQKLRTKIVHNNVSQGKHKQTGIICGMQKNVHSERMCLNDIIIHTNFHENWYINECFRMILEWSFMTVHDLYGHTLLFFFSKDCVFKMLTFLKKCF